MISISRVSLSLFCWFGVGSYWLAQTTAAPRVRDCDLWRVTPTDDKLKDVSLARTGDVGDDLKEAIAFLLAYGQQPRLENFLEQIVGPEFKLSVCDTNGLSTEGAKFKYKVFDYEADGDRNVVEKEMVLKQSDLAYAAGDRANIAIWPTIVFKALDGIDLDLNLENTLLRSQDEVAGLYHCDGERKYLCHASDLISRLMGIELESTQRIMDDTKSDQVSITDIFHHASSGPTIVFKNKALTYIVRGVDGKADGDNTFKALWLDMQKSGGDDEMKYRIDKVEEQSGIKFKKIKGQHQRTSKDEHADVHIVHPFSGERKRVKA